MKNRVQLFCYHIMNSSIVSFVGCYAISIYLADNNLKLIYLLLLVIAATIVFSCRKSWEILLSISIAAMALFLGEASYELFMYNHFEKHENVVGNNVIIEGVVVEESVKVSNMKIKTVLYDKKLGRVLVYLDKFPEYKVGDKLFLIGRVELAPEFEDFSYLKYLQTESIFFVINKIERLQILGKSSGVWGVVYEYRNSKIDLINKTFHYPASALVKGMVFGISSDFNPEWEDILKKTGTMHVIAVSGFNISVLFNFIYTLNNFWNRKLINVLSVFLLIFFIILIGPYNYSALRAVAFAFFLILGKSLGRKISNLNLIALALLSILIFNPVAYRSLSLAFSLTSIIAIFYVNKVVKKYLKVPEAIALAIAISVFTGLIQVYFFKSFSLSGVIINIFVGPIVSLVTILSMLFVIIGDAASIFGGYISVPVNFFLNLLKFSSHFDFLYLDKLSIDLMALVLVYVLTVFLSFNKYFIQVYKKLSLKQC